MRAGRTAWLVGFAACALVLSGCGSYESQATGLDASPAFRGTSQTDLIVAEDLGQATITAQRQSSLLDLFTNKDDPNVTVEVNKYIWNATLEVLNFLPIEAADPFSGIIVYGYGRPPGGGRAYKATVFIKDPALDARSLTVALQPQGGGAATDATVRAVEDAILTRARQLRVQDAQL